MGKSTPPRVVVAGRDETASRELGLSTNPANGSFPVVGVGASAGGLEAFTQLVRGLPHNPDVALVLVQHLDPKHESMLVNIISRETKMPVHEVRDGMVINANHIYVGPPNADLEIANGVFHLLAREHVDGRHLPIDSFFRSLAEDQKTCAIGVILSGIASDGVEGMKAIKTEGGITFAQSPQSAKYDGMPQNAIDSGSVDFVFAPKEIARELAKIGSNPQAMQYRQAREEDVLPAGRDGLQEIFALLRRTTGIDFNGYKPGTIKRRIARRMLLHKIDKLETFVNYLQRNPAEIQTLCQYLLINVTSFFREPDVFDSLRNIVFPRILKTKPHDVPIRVWVPGCSTGEEAYSMAICLTEFLGDSGIPAQIFATDVNEAAVEKARIGRYSSGIESSVSPQRLKRFFSKLKDGYSVGDQIRKMCIFARHDLTQDPPFSNLDLISCFNVLIYLGPEAQERAIRLLHYAMRPTGFLILGKAEAISRYQDLFTIVDRKLRIYSKQPLSQRLDYGFGLPAQLREPVASARGEAPLARSPKFDLDREVDRIILNRYGPPGFVVDDKLHILKFRGRTRPYLDPSPGEPSFNLMKMIRPELVPEVRAALQHARKDHQLVRRGGVSVRFNGHSKDVELQVHPFNGSNPGETLFLVLLDEVKPPSKEALAKMQRGAAKALKGGAGVDRRALLQLRRDLADTKRQLRTTNEEAEAANEELQSANEELESRNEELQSANEELETAKEELQSANEELTTLNETLRNRNDELGHINAELEHSRAYSESIVNNTRYPLLVLDSDLRVQKANPMYYEFFQTTPEDTLGRPLHQLGEGQWNLPPLLATLGKLIGDGGQFADFEARTHLTKRGFRDFVIGAGRLEGSRQEGKLILLSIVDVTGIKRAEEMEQQRQDLARSNQDLEQFAHAASHDMREPLRMVISFLQMFSQRYVGKLDSEADEWIAYAVDGAQRMQHLIEALLIYAQVGRGETTPELLDCDSLMEQVRSTLDLQIRESGAIVECGPLPRLMVDHTEVLQLFQNLIGNAIKFRGNEAPNIRISSKQQGEFWLFSVTDNGIGIAREHQQRIFSMFQRLNDRSKYPGTGIGLAICKKIVTRLGGEMWVESEPGKGSVFQFTLPIELGDDSSKGALNRQSDGNNGDRVRRDRKSNAPTRARGENA